MLAWQRRVGPTSGETIRKQSGESAASTHGSERIEKKARRVSRGNTLSRIWLEAVSIVQTNFLDRALTSLLGLGFRRPAIPKHGDGRGVFRCFHLRKNPVCPGFPGG